MNESKLTKEIINPFIPDFSAKEVENLKLYFLLNKKYHDELNDKFREGFKEHPFWGPLLNSMPEDIQKQRNEVSQQLLYNAIYNNDWEAYRQDLIMQGVVYAKMGITFSMWYEIVAVAKDYLTPYILKEHGESVEKATGVLAALGKLTDFAMQGIAESFLIEKNKEIEHHRHRQEELINELQSFAYVVSHDLKSPLRGIAKISEWLLMDYSDRLDAQGKEQLHLLKNRVQRLDDLINGILSYSRLGRENEIREAVNIYELIKDVKGILVPPDHVNIKIQEGIPPMNYQREKLIQVFSNLISNAIKYNDKKDCEVTILFRSNPDEYTFSVKDNGPGIEKEYHEKVFKIFQTLQTKDEKDSTGIGLAIVKKIVEGEGGKVWIESSPGKGAEFVFTIPKEKA